MVEPQEAGIVKKIYELYLSGLGDCLIVQYLNEHYCNIGWTIKRVGYILSNERYIGDCLLQKVFAQRVAVDLKTEQWGIAEVLLRSERMNR